MAFRLIWEELLTRNSSPSIKGERLKEDPQCFEGKKAVRSAPRVNGILKSLGKRGLGKAGERKRDRDRLRCTVEGPPRLDQGPQGERLTWVYKYLSSRDGEGERWADLGTIPSLGKELG